MEPQQNLPHVVASSASNSSSKRPVKFVASDEDGLPLKRRQVQQACDACRRKKKRCPHGTGSIGYSFIPDGPSPSPRQIWAHQQQPRQPLATSHPKRLPLSPESTEQSDEASSAALVASQLVELSTSRFVGDLSPESVFIEAATNKNSAASRLHRNQSEVGTWARETPRSGTDGDGKMGPGRVEGHARSGHEGPHKQVNSLLTLSGRRKEQPHANSVRSHLVVSPPEQDYEHLCNIYLDQVHPILPILKETDVSATRGSHQLLMSTRLALLRQVIALAAGVDPSASKYLRLEPTGPLLTTQTFHQRLSTAIFASLDANVFADTGDRIRVLLIMSLFYQPLHASERDMSPLIFSQAVHHAQSIGVHLRAAGRSSEDEDAESLFCALSALDRMNAAFHGRPCLLHHRDTDRETGEAIARQKQAAFRLFLGVCTKLDRVIHLYRPRNDGVETVEMPIFESLIIDAGAEKLPSRLISTIEVFYHGVSVLSCRQSTSAAVPATPSSAHLPHPTINARRSLSADRIIDTVAASLSSPSSPDSIFFMPFVPYSVALSLSVVYLKMRHSKIPMYRLRARHRFQEIVALLQSLGELYTSARVNAALGTSILREMDKAAKELATISSTSGNTGGSGKAASAGSVPSPHSARRESSHTAEPSPAQPSRMLPGRDMNGPREQKSSPAMYQPHGGHGSNASPATAPSFTTPRDDTSSALTGSSPATQPQQDMSAFSTNWGEISDIDLFVHFDPGFDLSAVDAALEANLDMGYPQLWAAPWPE